MHCPALRLGLATMWLCLLLPPAPRPPHPTHSSPTSPQGPRQEAVVAEGLKELLSQGPAVCGSRSALRYNQPQYDSVSEGEMTCSS